MGVEYYSQRAADGGLIITEATDISKQGHGYNGAPGLYNQGQVKARKTVVKAIHDRVASATSMEAVSSHAITAQGRKDHVTPRALEATEIPGIVEDYKTATRNALSAGFDGVEQHSANGYLLEQFLCDSTNKRTDKYGGSIENRVRFLFEALESILSVANSSKVAIRLSPKISSRLGVTSYSNALIACLAVVITEFVVAGIASNATSNSFTVETDYTNHGTSYNYSTSGGSAGLLIYRTIMIVVHVVFALFVMYLRKKTRDRFQIPGNTRDDFFASLCCSCCVLAQMATHIKSYQPGSCDFGTVADTLPAYSEL
ncbi:12-oxophytodienoate reductase [Phytophthora megakarya]|uniref:12-oxophytodienoate reductase n=1 Tax=Phytophthora megakarya TaxID=4795 RepID=A0A225WSK8_9STRA|nr:12-oxophytodienoate reductase [Phytophthora megakarya]